MVVAEDVAALLRQVVLWLVSAWAWHVRGYIKSSLLDLLNRSDDLGFHALDSELWKLETAYRPFA